MFGISCAPELFQKVMESIVAGLDGVVVYLDDIMVTGRTQQEHDERLAQVMARLRQFDILLNEDKCVFNATRLEFLGHELSSEGVRPTESKIAAIGSFREPNNVSELRSFLGLVTYVGRFIPKLADKTEPLRNLLRTGERFKWQAEHARAFNDIKSSICETPFLGYYDPQDLCIVIADASPTGLGAVLLQEDKNGSKRIISFASKALTDTERKYFQTEKEALALVWAVDRFQLYLLGKRFNLVTDCKPLHFLFKERAKPCARIERWVLRLQSYSYDVLYQPGSGNLADALSRMSVVNPVEFRSADEACIYQLVLAGFPKAVTIQEVEEAVLNDEVIQSVIKGLESGEWVEKAKEYKPFSSELCVVANLLLRGDRLIIPEKLRDRVIEVAHESHPGMVTMKRRLRQKVWWPKLDKQVESYVKKCKACTLVATCDPPVPMARTKIPTKPWADLAVDFVGPLPSAHNLLVIIDYFSRFAEVIIMKQITANLTVRALHETFCRFGMPESIKTDNGPQFISSEFHDFCKQFGIDHVKTTPYWPQGNGEVERLNRSIGKRLKISQETAGSDWQWDLRTFVLMYNSTPHSTTGVAPSSMLFGRKLKDKLPGLIMKNEHILEEIRDRDHVKKMKEAKYSDERRGAKPDDLQEGDKVVTKRIQKDNKLSTTFDSEEFIVIGREGSDVTIKSTESGRIIHRNISHLKKLHTGETVQKETNETSEAGKSPGTQQPEDPAPTPERVTVGASSRPRRQMKRPAHLDDYSMNTII